MHENSNGTGTRHGKAARQWVEELGKDVTYEQVVGRLRDAGEHEISEGTFASYKSEIYGKKRKPAPPAITTLPDDRPPSSVLMQLAKFAATVESVGGISEARRMLDALEELAGRFGGR